MGKLFVSGELTCDACGWRVPMEYEKGALGRYITNATLKNIRAVSSSELDAAGEVVRTCDACHGITRKLAPAHS